MSRVGRRSSKAASRTSPFNTSCSANRELVQPGEERLQDERLQQLIDGAMVLAGELAQVEVGPTCDAGPSRSAHSRTSSALRIACSAPAKRVAIRDEPCGAGAWSAQPPPQRLPRDVAALEMADSDDVDERALGGVDAHGVRASTSSASRPRSNVWAVELVQTARSFQGWPGFSARDRDVDGGWDRVDELVACERRLQAKSARETRSAISIRSKSAGGASAHR